MFIAYITPNCGIKAQYCVYFEVLDNQKRKNQSHLKKNANFSML